MPTDNPAPKVRRRVSSRTPRGKLAWDKDRTRELFRRYKEEGDTEAREQEVIRMRFIDGLTQVEIADKLGISQVQVSRLLRRTLKKIQEKIDPDGVMR